MININLFAGPGCGKSTTAAGLFYTMKTHDYNVEFIQEYAKDLTYAGELTRLSDQLHILGEQYHRMYRLDNKVDFLIHDSPFLLVLAYLDNNEHISKELFSKFVINIFNSYNNINIFLERNTNYEFQQDGRNQDEYQSTQKDKEIKQVLDDNNINYITVPVDNNVIDTILNIVKQH